MLPDLRVEMMPVAALAPYAANARLHPTEQVAQLAAITAQMQAGETLPQAGIEPIDLDQPAGELLELIEALALLLGIWHRNSGN